MSFDNRWSMRVANIASAVRRDPRAGRDGGQLRAGLLGVAIATMTAGCTFPSGSPGPVEALAPEAMEALWDEAQSFPAFLEGVEARRDEWHENYLVAVAHRDSRERAEKIPGRYRLLAVAVDGCSDSVSTLPHVARLVEALPWVELRIIHPDRGRVLMERHRTPDDRAATPTLVLLDDGFEEAGCWIERPGELQSWYIERSDDLSSGELYEGKMAWYEKDRGESTLAEIVALLEGAHAGRPVCPTP